MIVERKKIEKLIKNKNIKQEHFIDYRIRIEQSIGLVYIEKRTDLNRCNGKIISNKD